MVSRSHGDRRRLPSRTARRDRGADPRGGARGDGAHALDRRRHQQADRQDGRGPSQTRWRADRGAGGRGGVHAIEYARRDPARRSQIPGAARRPRARHRRRRLPLRHRDAAAEGETQRPRGHLALEPRARGRRRRSRPSRSEQRVESRRDVREGPARGRGHRAGAAAPRDPGRGGPARRWPDCAHRCRPPPRLGFPDTLGAADLARTCRVGPRDPARGARAAGGVAKGSAGACAAGGRAAVRVGSRTSVETDRDRGLARAIDRVRGKFGAKTIVPGGILPGPSA